MNPLCSCSLEVESTTHFFLHCPCFSNIPKILFNELISICNEFVDLPDLSKVQMFLYGSPDLRFTQNSSIINASISYIIKCAASTGTWSKNNKVYAK